MMGRILRCALGSAILALPLSVLLAVPAGGGRLSAQTIATLQVEENLRAEPQGTILGQLVAGSAFPVVETQDNWVQVEVEGWIWTQSLQTTDRLGYDLVVSASPRENLRDEPSGAILGRMTEGTLFERVDGVSGWTRVRRAAYLWRPSVALEEGTGVSAGETGEGRSPSRQPSPSPAMEEDRWIRAGAARASILTGPDGDTLAVARPGTELRVLAREGNWVRVRLDGWSWAPEGAPVDSSLTQASPSEATPDDVAANPDAFRGQVVSWELQFVSLERAEPIRTDFYEGEPFLLTRTSSQRGAFVYVAVPPERLEEVQGLIPLERIRVIGRIRTGAASLTGNTVLDLLEISRLSGG